MKWQIIFNIAIPMLTLFLGFGFGLWGFLVKDDIKRKRDKRERELESLKKLKGIIERIDRYAKDIITKCAKDIIIRDEVIVSFYEKYEQALKEMEDTVVSCPESIHPTINIRYKPELQAQMHKALDGQGRIRLGGLLNITLTGLEMSRAAALKVIDEAIDKADKL